MAFVTQPHSSELVHPADGPLDHPADPPRRLPCEVLRRRMNGLMPMTFSSSRVALLSYPAAASSRSGWLQRRPRVSPIRRNQTTVERIC